MIYGIILLYYYFYGVDLWMHQIIMISDLWVNHLCLIVFRLGVWTIDSLWHSQQVRQLLCLERTMVYTIHIDTLSSTLLLQTIFQFGFFLDMFDFDLTILICVEYSGEEENSSKLIINSYIFSREEMICMHHY